MAHILDDTYIPYELNEKFPHIKPLLCDSHPKIYKLMVKQSFTSPVSVLNELSQLLHLAKPNYTLYNHYNGLLLCKLDFAECTFRTPTPKYHHTEIKNAVARLALDFFSN